MDYLSIHLAKTNKKSLIKRFLINHSMEHLPPKKGRKFWGESWWDGLHSGAAFYTPEHAEDYRSLVQGYKSNIPCKQCRSHFSQNLLKYPLEAYLGNPRNLLLWS